jgi:hypothetical protein
MSAPLAAPNIKNSMNTLMTGTILSNSAAQAQSPLA